MGSMTLSEELTWRGFVNQTTFKNLSVIDEEPINFYFGVDPSADSMTIGNLAAALMVRHFIDHGHKATLLVGGATGVIGDPDGKKEERTTKSLEEIAMNTKAIASQYQSLFADKEFKLVDNYDWFKDINYLDFLRNIGKHVPMRVMLNRDFVQSRLSEEGSGISYAEFSYSLIQGYDFLHLYRQNGVTLQLSGADQWGNSIAGVELIRRIEGGEAHVFTTPLVINKTTGVKFGKSEGGAIWLDRKKTSPFQFYQFWLNCDDLGVIDYLKIYTLLPKTEIEQIEIQFNEDRSSRIAQKTLAYEVTKLVHGREDADTQRRIASILFESKDYASLTQQDLDNLTHELPFAELAKESTIVDALVATGLSSSKRQAREFISNGAIWNSDSAQIDSSDARLSSLETIDNYLLLIRGKKHIALIRLI